MKRLHRDWYRHAGALGRGTAVTSVLACAATAILAAFVPSDVRVETADRTLQFRSGASLISAARICSGFRFVQFGSSGPTFAPDFHYVLVDVLGPFEPGNVGRNQTLVAVDSGSIVRAVDWPHYFGIRTGVKAVAWVSGERQSVRYDDGAIARIPDRPLHPLPTTRCGA